MKRNIVIVFILLLLFGIGLCEEILVKDTVSNLDSLTTSLSQTIAQNEDNLNTENVKTNMKNLENYWVKTKNKICFFANFDKIKFMDESLIKLDSAIKENDKLLAIENLSMVASFPKLINYVMGFNINNLF